MVHCGMYLRISREDGGRESDSIQNQRRLIHQFLERKPGWVLVGEWVDDGWSGSRFDRPGFRKMMQAAVQGEIGCIIVKDLSRLGREYIQTGYYLREIFPELGIRLIAIADHYDSSRIEWMEQSLLVPVLNLMNDAYCRDISGKVRWQQKVRREAGEYIGAFAVYGYRKSGEDIHRLIVDEEVRNVIVSIYLLRLSGMAAENIARSLNRAQIPSPGKYKRLQGSRYVSGFDREGRAEDWSALSVRRILQNEMYTGVLLQGKDRKISYKLTLRQRLPKQEWVRIEKGVPAVIPSWVYQRACSLGDMRLRCKKGQIFCGLWDGIWKNKPEGQFRWLWESLFRMLWSEGQSVKGEQISIAHDKTMCKEIYRSPGKNAKAAFFFHEDVCAAGGGMSGSGNKKKDASEEEDLLHIVEDAPYLRRLLIVIMCKRIHYEEKGKTIRIDLY